MEDLTEKEFNRKQYKINSKYQKHTGPRIKYFQKSTNPDSPHSRKWRKRVKGNIIKVKRNNNLKLAKNPDNTQIKDKSNYILRGFYTKKEIKENINEKIRIIKDLKNHKYPTDNIVSCYGTLLIDEFTPMTFSIWSKQFVEYKKENKIIKTSKFLEIQKIRCTPYLNYKNKRVSVTKIDKYIKILKSRANYIKKENNLYNYKDVISEFYVNIFSWSSTAITCDLLDILCERNITEVLDPFANSGFHACLLYEGLRNRYIEYDFKTKYIKTRDIKVIAYDIQPETELPSWYNVNEMDCYDIKWSKFNNYCLVLSWADSDELAEYCLDNFNGNIIISIGNYKEKSNYVKKLSKYNLLYSYNHEMPWGLKEFTKIYSKYEF